MFGVFLLANHVVSLSLSLTEKGRNQNEKLVQICAPKES
jgi:hypothetical protein